MVYPNADLLEKDAKLLEIITQIAKPGKRLKRMLPGERSKPKSEDFVLVDECDEVYFSNLTWFEKTLAEGTTIGFTATPPTSVENLESMLLVKFFGVNIFDSQLSLKLRDGEKPIEFDEAELMPFEKVPIVVEQREMPAIVFCDEEQQAKLEEDLEDHQKFFIKNHKNEFDVKWTASRLEALDVLKDIPMDNYPILFINDPKLMRGHNYRSEQGILLILCKGFKTRRDIT